MPATEIQGLVQLAINLGFAVTMALIIFVAYQKLVGRLADIIQSNTKAMTNLRAIIALALDRLDNRAGERVSPARRFCDEENGDER